MGNVEQLYLLPRRTRRLTPRRLVFVALAGASLAGIVTMAPGHASATDPHTGCPSVVVGQSSGWCGLYPGNAVANTPEQGQVSVGADGLSLTVQTQDAGTGSAPSTSFACLTATPSPSSTHRLQQTQCAADGGVWFPFSGGSFTVDLTAYPQFLNTQFTVQVAANRDANNANGDAFYNDFSASTVMGVVIVS